MAENWIRRQQSQPLLGFNDPRIELQDVTPPPKPRKLFDLNKAGSSSEVIQNQQYSQQHRPAEHDSPDASPPALSRSPSEWEYFSDSRSPGESSIRGTLAGQPLASTTNLRQQVPRKDVKIVESPKEDPGASGSGSRPAGN